MTPGLRTQEPTDFEYGMADAIEDGVLRDYDLTIPVVNGSDVFAELAELLAQGAGHYRRTLARRPPAWDAMT